MYNIRDWCISRQLWWGTAFRVHCQECHEIVVARKLPPCARLRLVQPGAGYRRAGYLVQLRPVPFSTLGWPDRTTISHLLSTSLLITGFDILFFWVAA